MLRNTRILIVEDDAFVGMDLADAIAEANGEAIGPIASIGAALSLIGATTINGAILDANVIGGEVTPVALRLRQASIPLIIHTGIGISEELRRLCPAIQVFMKPTLPAKLILALSQLMKGKPRPPAEGGPRRTVGGEIPAGLVRTEGNSDGSRSRGRGNPLPGFRTAFRF